MLLHYLGNSGTVYNIDFKRMLSEWSCASDEREKQYNALMQAIEVSASYDSKSLTSINTFENNFSEQSNWGLAIGKYHSSLSCVYHKTTANTFEMEVTYVLYDCYNFSNDGTEQIFDFLSSQMWELHHGGYAKNYEVHGVYTETVTWSAGETYSEGVINDAN